MGKLPKRNKTYGFPYMGSKSAIAEWVVSALPARRHFYDLFAGGCAVTHAALLLRRFETYNINDLNPMPTQLFLDALNGKYADEKRWISREEFMRLRGVDAYVTFCWSFGNDMRNYIYGKEEEPIKRALHYALYFADYQPMKELGYDLTFLDRYRDAETKYVAARRYLRAQAGRRIECQTLQNCERLASLQNCERLARLQNCANATISDRIQRTACSYDEVQIRENSVLYCDIPYENTTEYSGTEGFNHRRFAEWANAQAEPVIVSSYQMDPRYFTRFQSIAKRCRMCPTDRSKVVCEGLFVAVAQIEKGIFKI